MTKSSEAVTRSSETVTKSLQPVMTAGLRALENQRPEEPKNGGELTEE